MYSAIHSLPLDGSVGHGVPGSLDGTNLPGDACLVLTTDPKPASGGPPRLHERFVDAVTQLLDLTFVSATGSGFEFDLVLAAVRTVVYS
ncbi:hypothetical protein GH714_006269 [Hevea brasiliensis]|uniref:Uncharacterized protein n=1 Tax=Hevea brasiliensis TaxID=3981 RepID=A0A6A6KCG8_HEVBR|nr:hypothetical protein GH714_006269 [Hevea brasiliensis]